MGIAASAVISPRRVCNTARLAISALNACNIGRADDPDIDGTITLERKARYSHHTIMYVTTSSACLAAVHTRDHEKQGAFSIIA